ncbi:MAG TPA: LptF/LptG family permease [Rhabdochlamydiaceae bacterium]|nr:LptF/LptG family permease [Rhabdochlamydiaceae bacterium]
MRIWQRYLFFRLLWTFLFFLLCIVILYIAVDFSLNGMKILSKVQMAKFVPLFFSLAFLLAAQRVLLDLAGHGEITALQIAGLSTKNILSPFFLLSFLLALLTFMNFQWILPQVKTANQKIMSVSLVDGSEIVFQENLTDVFWIISFDEIWHIKKLVPPIAHFADHFVRLDGVLEKKESFDEVSLPSLIINEDDMLNQTVPLENRSLQALFLTDGAESSILHYRIVTALVPFVFCFFLFPIAIRMRRGTKAFVYIASSLFFFVSLMTLLDAILILAENQVVHPLAIWIPMLFCLIRVKR